MFMRPTTPEVHTQRDAVAGTCPVCQAEALQRYRVLSEGGWWNVVKCSHCLHSVSREPGPLLGPLSAVLHALIPTTTARKE
jgi:hypothetical protein